MIYSCVSDFFGYCKTGAKEHDERYPDYCGHLCNLKPDTCGQFMTASEVLVPMGKRLTELKRLNKKASRSARTESQSSPGKALATPGRTAARARRDTEQ